MKIVIEFEVKDGVDAEEFETDLGKAMDNWTDSVLDKCSSWKVGGTK